MGKRPAKRLFAWAVCGRRVFIKRSLLRLTVNPPQLAAGAPHHTKQIHKPLAQPSVYFGSRFLSVRRLVSQHCNYTDNWHTERNLCVCDLYFRCLLHNCKSVVVLSCLKCVAYGER